MILTMSKTDRYLNMCCLYNPEMPKVVSAQVEEWINKRLEEIAAKENRPISNTIETLLIEALNARAMGENRSDSH